MSPSVSCSYFHRKMGWAGKAAKVKWAEDAWVDTKIGKCAFLLVNAASLVQKLIPRHAILHQTFLPPNNLHIYQIFCSRLARKHFRFIIYSTTLVDITALSAVSESFVVPTHFCDHRAASGMLYICSAPIKKPLKSQRNLSSRTRDQINLGIFYVQPPCLRE